MKNSNRQRRVPFVLRFLSSSLLLLSLIAFTGKQAFANEFNATVTGVTDGDSLTIKAKNTEAKVILFGIDCPERNQEFGKEARQYTNEMCYGKTVKLLAKGTDSHKRIIAEVFLPDGTSLNRELVKKGLAWWSDKYAPNDAELKTLHTTAKTSHTGLWASARPIPPWIFRNGQKTVQAVIKPSTNGDD